MNILQDIGEALALSVDAIRESVVRVEARRRGASGTVYAEDGVIVAAGHAVHREEGIEVGLSDGATVAARLQGRDAGTDLAVLRVERRGLAPASFHDATELRVGHLLSFAARPGRTVRATSGIVSALADEWRSPTGGRIERYIEGSADLPFGFSGGPALDASGRVLGLATSGLLRGRSMVIPGVTVRRVVEALLLHGRIPRAYLGLAAYPARLPADVSESEGQAAALLVVAVVPDGPAAHAGILLGDVLVKIDGRALQEIGDLLARLEEIAIGSETTLRTLRAGTLQSVKVTVGAQP